MQQMGEKKQQERFKCDYCGGEIFVGYRHNEEIHFQCYRCQRWVSPQHYFGASWVVAAAMMMNIEPFGLVSEKLPNREALAVQLVEHCLKRGDSSLTVIREPQLRQGDRLRVPDLQVKLTNGKELLIEVKAASPSGIPRPRWYFNHLRIAAAQGDVLVLVGFPLPRGGSKPEPTFFVFRSEEIQRDALAISMTSEREKPLKWWDHRVQCDELAKHLKEIVIGRRGKNADSDE